MKDKFAVVYRLRNDNRGWFLVRRVFEDRQSVANCLAKLEYRLPILLSGAARLQRPGQITEMEHRPFGAMYRFDGQWRLLAKTYKTRKDAEYASLKRRRGIVKLRVVDGSIYK
ncbi:MAG: hypothetical protein GDA53_08110 [Rhodobacteraceae bacterium]|nr:hypothetical protein [Paracoccaceae bacterium]